MNGTSAPYWRETSAICASSVETTMRSKQLLSTAALIVRAIIGIPQKSRKFFLGIRLLPPLAGMTARFRPPFCAALLALTITPQPAICCKCNAHISAVDGENAQPLKATEHTGPGTHLTQPRVRQSCPYLHRPSSLALGLSSIRYLYRSNRRIHRVLLPLP